MYLDGLQYTNIYCSIVVAFSKYQISHSIVNASEVKEVTLQQICNSDGETKNMYKNLERPFTKWPLEGPRRCVNVTMNIRKIDHKNVN
jgi:hypothetical protein